MAEPESNFRDSYKGVEFVDASTWDHLKALFDQARALEPQRRKPFLDTACGSNPELRAELELLLANYDEAPTYFSDLAQAIMPKSDSGDPLIGRSISQYKIEERIGHGGMGVVYKAHHLTLDQPAALKFLIAVPDTSGEARLRLIHEAKATFALDHPNIGTVYDIDETDEGQVYIAMAYYEGETLGAKIRNGPLELAEGVDYAAQICEGLAKAHGRGIVHSDLKPSNVMVTLEGVAKLLDFGVAQIAGNVDANARRMGTIAYMSPEQILGKDVDHRTDIWSLGVLLYEIATAKHPFRDDGDSRAALTRGILAANPAPVRESAPQVTDEVERIVKKCLAASPDERYQTAASLFADLHSAQRNIRPARASRGRIFLTYKRGSKLDERVAGTIRKALEQEHEIYSGRVHVVGRRWMEQLENDLANSDFLIVLISEDGARSEMIIGEVEIARRIKEAQGSGPIILPVRLDYHDRLPPPFNHYMDGLDTGIWNNDSDTPHLLEWLEHIIKRGHSSEPTTLKAAPGSISDGVQSRQPNGRSHASVKDESTFYVERPGDRHALEVIERDGVTITVKGPRQMGKSSLLKHLTAKAQPIGKAVIHINFQTSFDQAQQDAERFFKEFCAHVSDSLGVENRVDVYWKRPVGNPHRCTRYFAGHVLDRIERPVVLAMDEVEHLFDRPYRLDFFGMLRSWHNGRAVDPIWRKLDLILATSTEPYELLRTPNLSPFNVGEVISLEDFTLEQVDLSNRQHGSPLSPGQVVKLFKLVHGHPYLVRTALSLVATRKISFDDLLLHAADEDGPFEDHLSYHHLRLSDREDMIEGFRRVLSNQPFEDERICLDLLGAGLVRRERSAIVPRCSLYATYFERLWSE